MSTTGSKEQPRRFISGVVEGFYGRPWTMEQRTELFKREQKWGLNTYLYAPKDDYKHRMYWRDLYSPEEAEQLIALISAAKQNNVDFVYAISPGLDITFSNPKEVAALKRKLDQVKEFGCRSFSLLFDDIETEMCPADKQAFSSFAHAQVAITNTVFQHLGEPETFLFCPTDYCARFCTPTVTQSSYLHTVGEGLLHGIDILWTGPKVVSHKISVESIEEVTSVLRRPPVIWDNIHANDYDPQRLFLGPFKDRPTELIAKLRGVLTNPNCEFYPNFVAIHTLATWCKANTDGGQKDVEMGEEEQDPNYSPQKALTLALTEWLEEFLSTDQPGGPSLKSHLKKDSSDEEPMQTDVGEGSYVPGPQENPLYTAEPLTLEDLKLLSDLFYLPYEHGPTARTMLQELDWLKNNSAAAAAAETDNMVEWCRRAQQFDDMCEAVVKMFNRLSNAPNRSILYDLYNYICDIKSGVDMARAYVKSLGGQGRPSNQLMSNDPEPWRFRGGLSGEFQRMLPCHGNRDLFRHPPMTAVYCMRPYCPADKVEVEKIFREMQRDQMVQPPLICDNLSAGDISPSPQCALVLEDDIGMCGYALALTDAKPAAAKIQRALEDSVLKDYPSLITIQVLPRVTDPSPTKHMIGRLLSSIRSSGAKGAFCELRHSDRRMLDFFNKLGSFKPIKTAGLPQDIIAMGTSL
ncbi:protein O-GlcNAcase [Cheilinus undulatus]|uniref:protein O-GlcNAcase n=1 Tax=Cheilinus undulatus TaxID=241271 RepID=UPI001BD41452|nr:protein O-GlcNAcase [Cheilinus undulatus]